jgi:nitrogen fixation/metabolism regulation signal transduction histidine kinase
VRVIAALALLGILCVGASAYLVQLTIEYFDAEVEASLAESEDVAEEVEPFYLDLVESKISAFQARGRVLALELALEQVAPEDTQARLQAALDANPDIVELRLQMPGQPTAAVDRKTTYPPEQFEYFDVAQEVPAHGARPVAELSAQFLIDPEIDARYQRLGARRREIRVDRDAQDDVETAVVQVIGIASALVLAIALLAGFVLARTTTKKAGELSRVMARVEHGDLSARVRSLGRDELGQLGMVFNHMLDELQNAQKKLAYLQRIGAWQEMARRIAHEIKNPLTPIQLAIQQLRDKDPGLSPEFSRLVQTSAEIVQDEVEGLRRMVTSFSRFAKMPEVRLEPVTAERILSEFERGYGHLTEDEEDVLDVSDETEGAEIEGDRQLLKQALVNLVENAVLSAREAGREPVRVEVTARREGDTLVVEVDDNGPGLHPDKLETVFEPYETSRPQGTGLGLAIVKKVVLDHGGEVWAETSPLGGARFVIRLPLRSTGVG